MGAGRGGVSKGGRTEERSQGGVRVVVFVQDKDGEHVDGGELISVLSGDAAQGVGGVVFEVLAR